ncbi:MAG TPA: PA0069 family radical SAM protein [bacterium]|nr:PA0069 family radical SAM protein [bacterium]
MSSQRSPRRIWNPPNPFDPSWTDWEVESAPAELETFEDQSRSVLSHNDSPDLGFRWSVNPYRGCMHACAYCYARPTHEYLGLGAGTDFERKIYVKRDAAALLDRAFRKPSWKYELVVFSGVTDCYQPVEATWGLTRACLEVCERHANPIAIVTKSVLVVRDIDVLLRIARCSSASVSMSIPFASDEMAKKIEPSAPSVRRRFAAVRQLSEAGVRVGVGVAPIIPGLNDRDVPEILQRAKENGAAYAFRTLLRLPGSVRAVFLRRLAEEYPDRAAHVQKRIRDVRGGNLSESRFGLRQHGKGQYWGAIDALWELWLRKVRLDDLDAEERSPAPPPSRRQGDLFSP